MQSPCQRFPSVVCGKTVKKQTLHRVDVFVSVFLSSLESRASAYSVVISGSCVSLVIDYSHMLHAAASGSALPEAGDSSRADGLHNYAGCGADRERLQALQGGRYNFDLN